MGRSGKMSSASRRRGKKKERNEDEEALEKEPNGSFAWKVLLPSQVRSLSQCETPDELQEKMATIMDFEKHEVDLKDSCQLDCYVIAFHWAKEKNFDERQLSGFMTLLSNLLENIRDRQMSKSANLAYLKECFSGVGSDNPDLVPIPLYFFKLEQAKSIMQYLINTLFYHYTLYQYIYTQQQDELVIGSDLCTEVCPEMEGPFPPPLEEGMPLETYEEFVVQHNAKKEESPDEQDDASTTEEITDAVLKAVESSESSVVKTVSTSELRRIIENVTKEMILPAKAEIRNKIKDKEAAYLARIGKIQVK